MRNPSAERTARGQRLFVVSLIAVLVGFLVIVQLRSQALVARSLATQDNTSIALLINDLNHANGQLLQQSITLDQRAQALRQGLVAGGTDTRAIDRELTVLRVVAGMLPVHGSGLEIRIDGPVMDFELQDAFNNLRNAGAEAAALNGYRIVDGTPIISRGRVLEVAGHPVVSPYVLKVIGDPEQLEGAADISASSLQTRVQVTITRQADVAITEVVQPRPFLYAQLGS
jgi:uncharacterized protein YlxW (UPF0749 family)